jgi:hypothetical protein
MRKAAGPATTRSFLQAAIRPQPKPYRIFQNQNDPSPTNLNRSKYFHEKFSRPGKNFSKHFQNFSGKKLSGLAA